MTAETQATSRRWPRPPEDGYTADDLFTLPDLPRHTELIDGSLVFMAPQRRFHSMMVDHLVQSMRTFQPAHYRVLREMAVILSGQTVLEPDVAVVHADRVGGPDQTSFQPQDLVLAVEVVSPSTAERDRDTKPHKYAGAQVPYFWRIERDDDRIVAYTYELASIDQRYRSRGTFVNAMVVDQPFAADIDLSQVDLL